MDKEELCAEFIRENYKYDPNTGHIIKIKGRNIGKIVGYEDKFYGYQIINVTFNNKRYQFKSHRLGFFLYYNRWSNMIDHINHDRSDNRIENLRECFQFQNAMNMKNSGRNTSGYKGVHWSKNNNKWRAVISKDNKNIHIGLFNCIKDAATAYNLKAHELFGEYASFNE